MTVERDFETYRLLLDLWAQENPTKTNKLQVLLAVNAILVSAASVSDGVGRSDWPIFVAGLVFSLIWTFSIGRTSLYQSLWQAKLRELGKRYPDDPRFRVIETTGYRHAAPGLLRFFGGVSSKWYLMFSPFGFALTWLVILLVTVL